MRRAARFFLAVSLAAGLVTVVACQEPTQVTIDIRLATAKCGEIRGTAITVGIRPQDTEEKVKSKFPSAETRDCDEATSRIGTLVITPSDEERASIIVVTSYGPNSPTDCQPPDYKDCIVARRQFTFTKHRRLSVPITIDPTCVNVPCDAFSTCRKGFCFASDAEACDDGASCLEPGATADGGTNPDAAVDGSSPDAFSDGSNVDAPPSDSGSDATSDGPPGTDTGAETGTDSGGNPGEGGPDAGGGLSCDANGRVICPPPATGCGVSSTNACCVSSTPPNMTVCIDTSGSAGSCPSSHANGRWCCSDLDCGPNQKCTPGNPTIPRQCCTVVASSEAGAMFSPAAPSGPIPLCL